MNGGPEILGSTMSEETGDTRLRALIVEDSEDDALLLVEHLKRARFQLEWQRVDTEQALLEALEKEWDIVFSDYSMPYFSGARALEIVKRHAHDIPFIFVSGTIGEETAATLFDAHPDLIALRTGLAGLRDSNINVFHEHTSGKVEKIRNHLPSSSWRFCSR